MGILNALGLELAESGRSLKSFIGTTKDDVLTGTAGNDTFRAGGGLNTMTGGQGDDIYIVYNKKDTIIELAGQGIDTVRSSDKFVLPANVENLILEGVNAWYGGGNALNNIITGNTSNQELNGGKGNDVLTGGGGSDIFVFNKDSGADRVTDFSADDKIRLVDYGVTSFAQAKGLAKQVGADTVFTLGADKVVLSNFALSTLTADNLQLGIDTSKMKLTFTDEFDSLSLLSEGGTWRTEYKPGTLENPLKGRSLHNEEQVYMDPAFAGTGTKALGVNPFSIDKGVLAITAAPVTDAVKPFLGDATYTSGVLTTKFTFAQQYGYFEIKAALPEGQGFWPAFWLMPTDNTWPPEIDIMEQLGNDPDTIFQTRHTAATADGKMDSSSVKTHLQDSSDFHTYGLSWTKEYLIWYIDGVETRRIETPADMNKPMYVLLNLAVGGDWGGAADATTGTGQYKIDYIHVFGDANTIAADPADNPYVTPPVVTTPTPDAPPASSYKITGSSVQAYIDFVMAEGQTGLTLVGDHALNGTGNDAGNRIIGNEFNNVLKGMGGNDTLIGGDGTNTLIGGTGDDTYVVSTTTDKIVELAGEGTESVQSTVTFTLAANVEHLNLSGNAAINGYGNDLANRIMGNDAANIIKGLAGNDTLAGGGGNDTIDGGVGNDIITGGAGNDRLIGGAGKDIFSFATGFGIDTITDFNAKEDKLKFDMDNASYKTSHVGSDTILTFGGGDVVKLLGVNLSDAALKGILSF